MANYPARKIGNEVVSTLGYGAMSVGRPVYGPVPSDDEVFKLFDHLYESGCTFWDTATAYGDSETVIGKWFSKNPGARDEIFLCTKFGCGKDWSTSSDPVLIREQIENSLKELQTDRIDLLFQHRPDSKVPIEIVAGVVAEFVKEGKVKHFGLSEANADTIRRAHAVLPVAAIQVEYSPWERDLEKPGGPIEAARKIGATIVAYSPTGRGLATGRFKSLNDLGETDIRRHLPKYAEKNWPRILTLSDKFKSLGTKYGASSSQIALAWLLEQGDDVIPIPSSRQVKYNEENLGALKVKLSPDDLLAVRNLCDEVHKDLESDARYPEFAMVHVYADTPPLDSWKGSA